MSEISEVVELKWNHHQRGFGQSLVLGFLTLTVNKGLGRTSDASWRCTVGGTRFSTQFESESEAKEFALQVASIWLPTAIGALKKFKEANNENPTP